MLYCTVILLASCVTRLKIARIISIASGVLWWQYVTYASSCIMTKASGGYHLWCTYFVCCILEGILLLELPKDNWGKSAQEGQESALKLFQFFPCRLSSNDMSTAGWSLVKLAPALRYLFHASRWKLLWYMLCGFHKEQHCLLSCVVLPSSLWCPLSFLGIHASGSATLFWVEISFYLVVMRQRFIYFVLVT